jgi:hypothetical protein
MKTKTLLSILMIALCSQLSHSQFLKNSRKETEQAIEEVIVRKTADKAAQMPGEGMDKTSNIDFGCAQVNLSVMLSAITDDTDFYIITAVGETAMGLTLDSPISIGTFTTANETRRLIENP